ncbi:hypothetical protein ACFL42_00545 [Candidatus Omnitrophota bacterium]
MGIEDFSDSVVLEFLERDFEMPLPAMRRIVKDFQSEMKAGLALEESSLKMIPTHAEKPTGKEKGRYIALDLGGTNLRVLDIELDGNGNISESAAKNFILDQKHITGSGEELFAFLADSVKAFIKERGLDKAKKVNIGFTFSFPMDRKGIDSGILLRWTKGFSTSGVLGKDVVKLLKDALAKKGVRNIRIAALSNDTVSTMVAGAYKHTDCDIGVILGTGTNACYSEAMSNIKKWKGAKTPSGSMIVNIEWGNFNKLRKNSYDNELNEFSDNPDEQILEKKASGKYLGELARLVLKDFIVRGIIFSGVSSENFSREGGIRAEHVSRIEADDTHNLSEIGNLLGAMGIEVSTIKDRLLVKSVCQIISLRAARIIATAMAAVVTKNDQQLSREHTVAIDGSVYEKHPFFAKNVKAALEELFGNISSRIKLTLTKDGSVAGSAILAAVASK